MNEKYPIGQFTCGETISSKEVQEWIDEIKTFPARLYEIVRELDEEVLENTYREGGWSIRQLVHHVADSHLNSYIRFKLALTENNPIIKPYAEDKWAELPDSHLSIEFSLALIQGLHERWVYLLENLTDVELKRTFTHPDSGVITLAKNIGLYAWHGNHHLAHIKNAVKLEKHDLSPKMAKIDVASLRISMKNLYLSVNKSVPPFVRERGDAFTLLIARINPFLFPLLL